MYSNSSLDPINKKTLSFFPIILGSYPEKTTLICDGPIFQITGANQPEEGEEGRRRPRRRWRRCRAGPRSGRRRGGADRPRATRGRASAQQVMGCNYPKMLTPGCQKHILEVVLAQPMTIFIGHPPHLARWIVLGLWENRSYVEAILRDPHSRC